MTVAFEIPPRAPRFGHEIRFLALLVVCGLLCGCGSSTPPVGEWFGPTVPAVVTIEHLPKLDAAAVQAHTLHYNIYSTIGDDGEVNRIAQLMEGSFAAYRTLDPDIAPTHTPMECYVFGNHAQWAEFTREKTGASASIYLQINRGGYTIGDWYVSYYLGENSTLSVAAHEGWHQYAFRHFKGRLPPFMDEGFATLFEGVKFRNGLPRYNLSINQNRAIALRRAIEKNQLFPLEQVVGMHAGQVVSKPGDEIEAFYAQAWGFARYLWDADGARYRPAMRQILSDTAAGTVYDPTYTLRSRIRPWNPACVKPMLEHYLGMPFAQIDQDYNAFIRHVADDELPSESDEP